MRVMASMAMILVLAACSSEPVEAPVEEEVMTTANGSPPGIYAATGPEGHLSTLVLNRDGTFTERAPDGSTRGQGTWEVIDGQTCFTSLVEEGMACFTESPPAEDGSFTATPAEGPPLTIRPVREQAPEAG